jgi:hypothetical protein
VPKLQDKKNRIENSAMVGGRANTRLTIFLPRAATRYAPIATLITPTKKKLHKFQQN